nr:DUF951 domain-containing protein [Chloroflexota bacterium]
MPIEVFIDDIVRLRKVHPCGSYEWRVVRIGADIGLKCLGCGRRILLPRSTFERRLKAFVARAPRYENGQQPPLQDKAAL